jgi:predicted DNA-binding protein
MPTAKKRINLTVEDEVFKNLKQLAEKENTSVAHISHVLLERALELKEDFYFSKVSEERLDKKIKRISHKEIWE